MRHRFFIALVIVTVFSRGLFYVSFPLTVSDDDQAFSQWQFQQIEQGDWHIGNLRYHTGYTLLIAPLHAFSHLFGDFSDNIFLLIQTGLSALVPFLILHLLAQWRPLREAYFVAFVVALDPFGIQWAHFLLPNWLTTLLFILAIWIIFIAVKRQRHILFWTFIAGIVLGLATLTRLNIATAVAAFGLGLFFITSLNWWQRFRMFAAIGMGSLGVLVLYAFLVQLPSTGSLRLSCYSGINMLISLARRPEFIEINEANGPATHELLSELAKPVRFEPNFTVDYFPNWSLTDAWATQEELEEFLTTVSEPNTSWNVVFPGKLIYYMGICEVDDLMQAAHNEAVLSNIGAWLRFIPGDVLQMLAQWPQPEPTFYLPPVENITFDRTTGILGFYRGTSDHYTGQYIWEPGNDFLSHVFNLLNLYKILTPIAVIWALFISRSAFYKNIALVLLIFVLTTSIVSLSYSRLYAPLYALWPILCGGMMVSIGRTFARRMKLTSKA